MSLDSKDVRAKLGPEDSHSFRIRGHEISRIEAFSDVVIGFALTLLVVSLEVPRTFDELLIDMRGFVPFAICFAVLVQVWWIHHQFFRRYGMRDSLTAVLNFILLFVILFYVYPLKFLFTGLFNELTGHTGVVLSNGQIEPFVRESQVPLLMIIYGLGYATVFFIFVLLFGHALGRRQELGLNEVEVFDTRSSMWENGFMGSTGLLSAAVAAVVPTRISGVAGYIYLLIPVGMWIIGARRGKARRRLTEGSSG